ncbi:MAG: succinylglutamate desuccinylase/aspartoacylase family protein [Alphaproteobacteria bacterium]
MTITSEHIGMHELPVIRVRVGQNPAQPHQGTLSIDDWTVPCATGRGGLVAPDLKREGDGATPIGCFPLRYGFFDPTAFAPDLFHGMAFPFVAKPSNYDWPEDGYSPFYNRLVYNLDPSERSRLGERIFDLIVPIGWNDSTPRAFGGSAIFLHVARPDFTPTAGCVVVAHEQVLNLTRRLRPGMMIDIAHHDAETRPLASAAVVPQAFETVSFHSLSSGPRVIVTGGVHGNEHAGPRAISRLIWGFRSGELALLRGSVTFVPAVNRLAFAKGTREGDRNLNRDLAEKPTPQDNEDRVANLLCPLLRGHDVLIDLHSFSAEGEPMVLCGPPDNDGALEPFRHAAAEAALARALGLPLIVHGWLAAHEAGLALRRAVGRADGITSATAIGTTEYMRFAGGYGVTVECGPHDDPQGAEVGYKATLRGLAHLGLIAGPPQVATPYRALQIIAPILAEDDADHLSRRFKVGEAVSAGQVIGHRASGAPITIPHDGAVIFASLNAAAGTELCFLCRHSPRF